MARKRSKHSSTPGLSKNKTRPAHPWLASAILKAEIPILIVATANYVRDAMKTPVSFVFGACIVFGIFVFLHEFWTARKTDMSFGVPSGTLRPYLSWVLAILGIFAIAYMTPKVTARSSNISPTPIVIRGGAGVENTGGG